MRVVAIAVIALAHLLVPSRAEAQACTTRVVQDQAGQTVTETSCVGQEARPIGAPSQAAAPVGPPVIYKPVLDAAAPGGGCVEALAYGPEEYGSLADGSPNVAQADSLRPAYAALLEGYLDEGYVPCAGSSVPALTPRLWAESWVRSQVLPVPEPSIGAGTFVVGLDAFLESGATLALERDEASPFGPAVLSLSSELTVDWGDGRGEDEGPFSTVGAPYPEGEITHVFQQSGFYDVVVTQHWTLDWSVGGTGGSITGVTTEGTLEDFEVYSVEAVIVEGPSEPTATLLRDPGE